MAIFCNGVRKPGLNEAGWSGGERGGHSPAAGAELAALPGGSIAMRNAGHPDGAALVYTRPEIEAFIAGAKDGEFDDLIG